MYARDKNYRMPSKTMLGREFIRNHDGWKGSQRKHFQLPRASKGKVVESSSRFSAMIQRHRSLIQHHRSLSDDRSINIHNNNNGWIGQNHSSEFIMVHAIHHYKMDNLGEISKLLVC